MTWPQWCVLAILSLSVLLNAGDRHAPRADKIGSIAAIFALFWLLFMGGFWA